MVSAGVTAIGGLGGGILALCLVPQLIKLLRTKSSRDISITWLLGYLSGLILTWVYLYYEDAVITYAFLTVEIASAFFVLGYKLYLEHAWPGRFEAELRGRSADEGEGLERVPEEAGEGVGGDDSELAAAENDPERQEGAAGQLGHSPVPSRPAAHPRHSQTVISGLGLAEAFETALAPLELRHDAGEGHGSHRPARDEAPPAAGAWGDRDTGRSPGEGEDASAGFAHGRPEVGSTLSHRRLGAA